ncbi:Cytochrome b5 type B (outer mitochondrial membrane) [Rhinocladiella similis]
MSRTFSLAEVDAHHSERDLYLVIHNNVYDVSEFIQKHPGGPEKLLETESSNVTDPFENAEHSKDARELLKTMLIGTLEEEDVNVERAVLTTSTATTPKQSLYPSIYLWLYCGIILAFILMNADDWFGLIRDSI